MVLSYEIDKSRFVRGGPYKRGYIDLLTGQAVSRRQAIQLSQGKKIEQMVRERGVEYMRLFSPIRRTRAVRHTQWGAYLERKWKEKRGTPTRGPNADPEFLALKKELKDQGLFGFRFIDYPNMRERMGRLKSLEKILKKYGLILEGYEEWGEDAPWNDSQ